MTPAEVSKLLERLKGAYPRQAIDESFIRGTIPVYVEELADLDAGAAMDAVKLHIRSSPFFPTVAEIRQRVAELNRPRPELRDSTTLGLPAEGETIATADQVRAAMAKLEQLQDEWRDRGGLSNPRAKPWVRNEESLRARERAERELEAAKGRLPAPDARAASMEPPKNVSPYPDATPGDVGTGG